MYHVRVDEALLALITTSRWQRLVSGTEPLSTLAASIFSKLLKALLSSRTTSYRLTHDLQELMQPLLEEFPELSEFREPLADFTPYAVRMRYDETVYPDADEARAALEAVRRLRSVVHSLLPREIVTGGSQAAGFLSAEGVQWPDRPASELACWPVGTGVDIIEN